MALRVPLNEEQFADTESAQFYDEHARRFMGSVYRRFAARVAGISPPGKRVLDLGTGSGRLAIALAKDHPDWQITGIDISAEMLKLAGQNAAKDGLTHKIDFRQAPAAALPFPDGYFALVVSNNSLHLWAEPLKVFGEIERVTSPGGYCLIRDNLRITVLHLFINLAGWAMGMNAAQRRLWMQAIRSSYTGGEARAILKESALKDARVMTTRYFELSIEWRKSPD